MLARSRSAESDQFVTCMVIQFLQTSWRCVTLHRPLTTLPWRLSLWQTPIRHGWQLPLTLNHSSVYQDHSPSCLDPAEWKIRAQSGSRGILGSMLNMARERLFIFSQPSGKVLPILYNFRDKPENCCLSWSFSQKYTITVKTCIFCDIHWFWDVIGYMPVWTC